MELPIEHISYSSMTKFLSNPQMFKKNYILNIWDFKKSPSAITGSAFHRCMEMRYKGLDWEAAIKEGYNYIDSIPDSKVDWGKTGSREKCKKEYGNTVKFWRDEEPFLGEVLGTEVIVTANVDLYSGQTTPLPLKAVIDLVSNLDGNLRTWDYKVVSSFTDLDVVNPKYVIQAVFNYYAALSKFGDIPEAHTYIEIKKSANRGGGKQLNVYELRFSEMEHYLRLFESLYRGVVTQLANPDYLYLPNFGDQFTGSESWEDFSMEALDFEMPKNIIHKSAVTRHVIKESQYVEAFTEGMSDAQKIESKFMEFGINMQHAETHQGANVTLHTFKPSRGVKMSQVSQRVEDIALAVSSESVRIQAPILGTDKIGVEVGNLNQGKVDWNEVLLTEGTLQIPVGIDVYNNPYRFDLEKAPHLLVAGTTGSGKSVFLNVLIETLMRQNSTEDLQMVLIDPKQAEFVLFDSRAHLMIDTVTEPFTAEIVLESLVERMNHRYSEFKDSKVRNITEYNNLGFSMERIVVVIDELADLFESDEGNLIQSHIRKLVQKARAAGIHLVVATQRPSVDVVSGVLKANMPTRIAFRVATRVDSQVILDQVGAEQLLGNGDCLLMSPKERNLVRLQSYFL